MLISVVNLSEFTDETVQEVLRAINRQIAEDFAPYWHRSGELRLEGAIGRKPNPKNPQELRGDAILYLWSEVDQQNALGYHDLNFRGIPFSVVFTELSEEMGEDWTVTLSHEALELLMDPESNLLVAGPHPEDADRRVYHWYEMCDAVQAQSYEIDGVAVSNFVLPLYFTEGDEKGSRNDFLGSDEGEPLASFGVAPGGYVGFFDPEVGDHDQFVSPQGRAAQRLAARQKAGLTRRAVRRQVETSPEPVVRKLLRRSPDDPLPGPWFEGFAIDVDSGSGQDPFDLLEAAAAAALGEAWRERWEAYEPTRRVPDGVPVPYELVPRGASVDPAEAWDLAYALREQPGVVDVEPDFVLFRSDSEWIDELPRSRRWAALFDTGGPDGSADDCEWSLIQMRARQAHAVSKGQGIRIGHPDTGFLQHPEIWPGSGGGPIDTTLDYDFVGDEDDAHAEPTQDDLLPGGPNHGTSTASVIVSAEGPADGDRSKPWVTGVAPSAKLVPLRVSNSVVHFSMRRLRKAIEYALDQQLHVLSMSLGGPLPNRHLHRAIREAVDAGMVLVAAAGNHVPFKPVVWPARYAEVVACAACNIEERPWGGSSRGERIDITAPGESVWRALFDTEAQGSARFQVERSSGTSYATANVAGVCALWLSHHGRPQLVARYGGDVANAFRFVLARTARPSPHLDPGEFGPGIVDAQAVLAEPLPSRQAVRAFAAGAGRARRARGGGRGAQAAVAVEGALETMGALLPHFSRAELRRGLESLLATDARGLAAKLVEVGDELAFRIATDPKLARRFSHHCRRSSRQPAAAGRGARARSSAEAVRRFDALAYGDLRAQLSRRASKRLRLHLE